MDANLYRRTNVPLDDLNLGASSDVSRGHRMNDPLDDLNLDVMKDESHDHHKSDRLVGHLMGVSRVNRSYVRRDLKMDGNLDVSLCLRMSDLLVGLNLDVNHDLYTSGMDDQNDRS